MAVGPTDGGAAPFRAANGATMLAGAATAARPPCGAPMVPSQLRWLESEAPDVLPVAVRAHRVLLFAWLPLVALAAGAMYVTTRAGLPGPDPIVGIGTLVALAWLLVFVPPALVALPVAIRARRAARAAPAGSSARRRLSRFALLHVLPFVLALLGLVPSASLAVPAVRHWFGGV